MSSKQELFRKLPAVNEFLENSELKKTTSGVPRKIVVNCVRTAVEEARSLLAENAAEDIDEVAIRRAILSRVEMLVRLAAGPHYRKVINATGIILHTALGRAVLASCAIEQIEKELSGYSLLQADLETGARGTRDGRIEWLLQQLTGAEAATVVNNNSAATMIVLSAVAAGREVIVSRGQLVEIGGSFRLPEVMEASGAKLVEVGTTNKTHPRDYENAITENTAAIMRVHPSNYKISGFTSETPLDDMIRIAHAHDLAMIDDVGAGPLVDFSRFGFEPEPTLPESVRSGADLITASADKLIGASQGGIILGRAKWVEKIRKSPLARIVRVGKLTLAALEATLTLFLDESLALDKVPTLRMLQRDQADISRQAERIAEALAGRTGEADVSVTDGFSQMGSGSLPAQNLPTRLVTITPGDSRPGELADRLRRWSPPIFARVHKGLVLCDPRTLQDGEEQLLVDGLIEALGSKR